MGILRISLFGPMHVEHDEQLTEITPPRVVQNLLAYLLLTPYRYHSREALMARFWEDYPSKQARSCLRTALWRLRQILEPDGIPKGTYLLTTSSGDIGFNWDGEYWLDVVIFEKTIEALIKKAVEMIDTAETQQLENTLALCTGDLLEGVYEDWALRERERLRQLYMDGLEYLMLIYKHHQAYKQSLACGQQILDHDPLRESVHRELMRIYCEAGQPTRAVQQYQICQKILAQELKIAPMAETQALHSQIISATERQKAEQNTLPPVDFQQAMQQLQLALEESQKAQENLRQAAALVQRYVDQQVSDT